MAPLQTCDERVVYERPHSRRASQILTIVLVLFICIWSCANIVIGMRHPMPVISETSCNIGEFTLAVLQIVFSLLLFIPSCIKNPYRAYFQRIWILPFLFLQLLAIAYVLFGMIYFSISRGRILELRVDYCFTKVGFHLALIFASYNLLHDLRLATHQTFK